MTIIAVLVGYFLDSLPGIEHTAMDQILIDGFRKILPHGKNTSKGFPADRSSKYERVAERFLILLADQQLVTSIAMILAAFLDWHNISLYSFEMAFSMAVISLVTHLATLRFCPG